MSFTKQDSIKLNWREEKNKNYTYKFKTIYQIKLKFR